MMALSHERVFRRITRRLGSFPHEELLSIYTKRLLKLPDVSSYIGVRYIVCPFQIVTEFFTIFRAIKIRFTMTNRGVHFFP